MQKSALQYGEIIFQSKVIPLFLPKCSKLHSFFCFYNVILLEKLCKKVLYSMAKLFFNQKLFLYMVYCIPYMEVNVDFLPYMEVNVGKKKNMAK